MSPEPYCLVIGKTLNHQHGNQSALFLLKEVIPKLHTISLHHPIRNQMVSKSEIVGQSIFLVVNYMKIKLN